MKKKIILKRIFHRNEWRYAIIFEYDKTLVSLVKSINGIKWSQSNKCWYAGSNEETLKQILVVFRESADIDISAIASGKKKEISASGTTMQHENMAEVSSVIPVSEEEVFNDKAENPAPGEKLISKFAPVQFTISIS